MRCKKHLPDLSSNVGVCATCLRERLIVLVAVEDGRRYDPQPPPLLFPRSVSPYITRRKSDYPGHSHTLSDQRFYSTPQVGPTGVSIGTASLYKKKSSKFSLFSNLFRSKSRKVDFVNENPRVSVSNSGGSHASGSPSSPSWFSAMLSGRRKKQSRLFTTEENHNQNQPVVSRRPYGYRDRGMSPARYSQDGVDEECHTGEFSGYSSESSQGWRETPKRATAYSSRRNNRLNHSRNNVTGLTFCLSPLVRASPNRRLPPETSLSGDKPHLSNAASYCANRSRKLADIGRFNPNY